MSARTNPRCTAARRNVAARETGDLVIEYFILSPVCNAHTPTATRSRFFFKTGTEKENISRCVMRGREGYGITEVGRGGRREGIQLSSAGWGGGRLSATPTSTALTLRVKVWYGTGRVYTAVLYVERSGQLRLCLTPHPPVPGEVKSGQYNR